jgi:2-polyprenyl-3-methyl-5-hydroxy-6-metoxy-1,4-benzoquinol methylase
MNNLPSIKLYVKKWLQKKGYLIVKQHDVPFDSAIEYNKEENITAFYNNEVQVASYINNVAVKYAEIMLHTVKQTGINMQHKSVADMACGTGHFLQALSNTYALKQATGYEINEAPLRTAKKLFPNIQFEINSVYEPLPKQVDVIFLNHVLEHLPYPETCLLPMMQSLNTGGHIIIHVPNGRVDQFGGHIHFFSKDALALLIKKYIPNGSVHIGYTAHEEMIYCLITK